MRTELKFIASIFLLGMSLVAYANQNFMTKQIGELIFDALNRIEQKVDKIEERVYRMNGGK